MAIGSLLLVLLYFFSRWAPLQTVNWAIRNIIGYVVFAGIVLFQSDIRRALAHFGRAPVFRYFQRRNAPVDDVIEELVVAATMATATRRDHRHRACDRPAKLHRVRGFPSTPP